MWLQLFDEWSLPSFFLRFHRYASFAFILGLLQISIVPHVFFFLLTHSCKKMAIEFYHRHYALHHTMNYLYLFIKNCEKKIGFCWGREKNWISHRAMNGWKKKTHQNNRFNWKNAMWFHIYSCSATPREYLITSCCDMLKAWRVSLSFHGQFFYLFHRWWDDATSEPFAVHDAHITHHSRCMILSRGVHCFNCRPAFLTRALCAITERRKSSSTV